MTTNKLTCRQTYTCRYMYAYIFFKVHIYWSINNSEHKNVQFIRTLLIYSLLIDVCFRTDLLIAQISEFIATLGLLQLHYWTS